MRKFVLTWPDFNTRAFTMSYDDGTVQDVRVMDLCRRFGMGATFALVSGYLDGPAKYFNHLGQDVYYEPVHKIRVKYRYDGFEIAGHTEDHPRLVNVPDSEFETQVKKSNEALSDIVGYTVRGMTYPMNSYDARVCEKLRGYGVLYSRTTEATFDFAIPEDFFVWHPTCHDHDKEAPGLVDKCLSLPDEGLKLFYIWGHAYELDKPDSNLTPGMARWQDFEALLRKVAESDKFWCVSNIEIYDYVAAVRKLHEENGIVRNDSDKTIYGLLDGERVTLLPGETLECVSICAKTPER